MEIGGIDMNYIIIEIQGNNKGGAAVVPPVVKPNRQEADNAFFTAAAAAAMSSVPFHSVTMLDELGVFVRREAYDRRVPESVG